jgi:hypothetical protein
MAWYASLSSTTRSSYVATTDDHHEVAAPGASARSAKTPTRDRDLTRAALTTETSPDERPVEAIHEHEIET